MVQKYVNTIFPQQLFWLTIETQLLFRSVHVRNSSHLAINFSGQRADFDLFQIMIRILSKKRLEMLTEAVSFGIEQLAEVLPNADRASGLV